MLNAFGSVIRAMTRTRPRARSPSTAVLPLLLARSRAHVRAYHAL
jgi:hypothetical protein